MSDTQALARTNGHAKRPAAVDTVSAGPVQLRNLDDVFRLGEVLARSGFFSDARDAGKAVTKVIAGAELGISPIASMTGIHVIKGKITMGANLIASQIKRHPHYDYRVTRMDDDGVEIVFLQDGEQIGTSKFDRQDAKKAGTQNMGAFPRNMLFARAMTNGAKWFTPDVFNGPVYVPEEMGVPVDGEGNIEDAYWEEHETPATPRQQASKGELSQQLYDTSDYDDAKEVTDDTPGTITEDQGQTIGTLCKMAGITTKAGAVALFVEVTGRDEAERRADLSFNEAEAIIARLEELAQEDDADGEEPAAGITKKTFETVVQLLEAGGYQNAEKARLMKRVRGCSEAVGQRLINHLGRGASPDAFDWDADEAAAAEDNARAVDAIKQGKAAIPKKQK